MQALHDATGIALNLVLELLGLIFTAELQLLDLVLLLAARFVQGFVLGLQLELTTQLAVVQLLLRVQARDRPGGAGGSSRSPARRLVQLGADERMGNRRKGSEDAFTGRPGWIVEADVELPVSLITLQKITVDAVVRRVLCRASVPDRRQHCSGHQP
jgi:hypothetical protein